MKEVKKFIIVDLIILLIKVLGGILCNSKTILASATYELSLLIIGLFVYKRKDNKRYKGVISSIYGIIVILLGLGIIYLSVVSPIKTTSWFIILFVVLTAIVRYIVNCFNTNFSYQKKVGLLSLGNINSTVDFINYGVILGALILTKLSKWVKILKYADILGTVILASFVIYKGFIIIYNSIRYLENKDDVNLDSYVEEIEKRNEIKKVDKLTVYSFGGIKLAKCDIMLNNGVSLIDVNTFVLTLQDYLLKISDMVRIDLVVKQEKKKTKVKVRSKKADARNSGSGNSKTNTKKKNTKKKNKKR